MLSLLPRGCVLTRAPPKSPELKGREEIHASFCFNWNPEGQCGRRPVFCDCRMSLESLASPSSRGTATSGQQ